MPFKSCFQTVLYLGVLAVVAPGCVEDTNFLNPRDYLSATKKDAAVSDDAAVANKDAGQTGTKGGDKPDGPTAISGNDAAVVSPGTDSGGVVAPGDSGTTPTPDSAAPNQPDAAVAGDDSGV